MSVTLPLRAQVTQITRRFAAFAAIGLVGALSPLAVAAPAAAAPRASSPCPALFGATAAGELLALRLLDLAPLGLSLQAVNDLHVSTTRSGMAGGPPHAAAEAHYLQGALGAKAYQSAPPPNEHPVRVPTVGINLPALKVGTGGLTAHATIDDGDRCEPGSGPSSQTDAELARVRVLPHGDASLFSVDAIATHTEATVVGDHGRAAAGALAAGDLTRIELFGGTPAAIGVKVVSQPKLRVVAGSKQTADYTAPILEVKLPGRPPLRLATPGSHFEVAVPVDAAGADRAAKLGLPVAPGLSLRSLLGRTPQGGAGKVAVLQLSLGALSKEITATGLHASATTLRVKLLVLDAYGGGTALVDLGLCVLDAAADSPKRQASGDGYGGYGDTGDDNGGGSNGGVVPTTPAPSVPPTLPVTGSNVAFVLGGGVLLVLVGRFLMVTARKRSLL